jgi:hypothetical protein
MLMRLRQRRAGASRQAITDVYDETRGAFRVQYPAWLILGLGLAGVAAFALTGFMDGQPLILYLWLCALVIALQASIFRHASMRVRLVATLTVTVLGVLLVGIGLFGNLLPPFIQQSIDYRGLANRLAAEPWTYSVLNFGLLAIFWLDTVRRWVRRARGLAPAERVPLTQDEARQTPDRQDIPSLEELIAGDLIAGGVLVLALSFLFQPGVMALLFPHVQINACTLSWPLASCTPPGDPNGTATLAFIDRIQALIYFPLGLIILALTAVLSGLGAAGGVNANIGHGVAGMAQAAGVGDRSSSSVIAQDVTTTVVKTLRSALDRRLRHLARNLALSLRTIAWPALILLAIYGLGQVSTGVYSYLRTSKAPLDALRDMGPALGWGVVAAFAVAFSAALLVFRWRVADNTLRFLGLIGLVLLLTFWLFSAALAVLNLLLNYTNVSSSQPFLPLGAATYLSLAALLILGPYALWRRARRAKAEAAAAEELASGGARD